MSGSSTHQPDTYHFAEWVSAVYEHEQRPPAKQRDILTALAVRFCDWGTGTGYASIKSLASYCHASRATVQRALRWGRQTYLIIRLSRGHRAGNGIPSASLWKLISSQGINTPAVETISRHQG